MDERRQALGMTWAEVAREAGITVETLRAIRRGKNEPSDLTKRGLDRALRWRPGGTASILAGREPHPIDAPPPGESSDVEAAIEGDSSITPQLRALLEQAQRRTNERLAELTEKVDEQNEILRRILEDRRGA